MQRMSHTSLFLFVENKIGTSHQLRHDYVLVEIIKLINTDMKLAI